jgi:chromosome segregation ATPase
MSGSNGRPYPHLSLIAEAATQVAACEKVEEKTRDEWLLADAAARQFDREMGKASPVSRNGEVVWFENLATGKRFTPNALRQLQERVNQAESQHRTASDALSAARGKLHNLQKAAENWENAGRNDAAQAAARAEEDARLTPHQRAIRDARRLLDAEGIR